MGRKTAKIRNTQPTRTFTTKNTPTNQNKKQTNLNTNTNTNNNSLIGDSIKQGIGTGIGFGMANAAVNAIFQGGLSSSPQSQDIDINKNENQNQNANIPKRECETFFEMYTQCLKSQIHISESNCDYLLQQFKKCSTSQPMNANIITPE